MNVDSTISIPGSQGFQFGDVWSKGLYPTYSHGRKILEFPLESTVSNVGKLGGAIGKLVKGGTQLAEGSQELAGRMKIISDVGSDVSHGARVFSALVIPFALLNLLGKVKDVADHFFGVDLWEAVKNPEDTAKQINESLDKIKQEGLTRDRVWTFIQDRTKKCGADLLDICGIVGKSLLGVVGLFSALEHFALIGEAAISWTTGVSVVGGVFSAIGFAASGIQGCQALKLRYEIEVIQWRKGSENQAAYEEIVNKLSKQDDWTLERVGLKGWNSKAKGLQESGESNEVLAAKSFALANSAKKMLNRQLFYRAMTMTIHLLGLVSLGIIVGTTLSGGTLIPATLIALGIMGGISGVLGFASIAYKLIWLNNNGDPTSLTYMPFPEANKKFVVETLCGGKGSGEIGKSEQKLTKNIESKRQNNRQENPVGYWYSQICEGQWAHDLVAARRRSMIV